MARTRIHTMNNIDSLAALLSKIHLHTEEKPFSSSFAPIKELVGEYVENTVHDALLVIVHGSAVKGNMSKFSDIDIIIVRKNFNAIRKHISQYRGYCLDVIETGAAHIEGLLDNARISGENWIVSALAQGEVVWDKWERTLTIRKIATSLLHVGPDAPSKQQINILRSSVTGLVSQLCRSNSAEHTLMIGLTLFTPLTSLLLKQQQSFTHRGKHLANHLETVAPTINNRMRNAYAQLLLNEPKELALLAHDILQPVGGWLLVGFENSTELD